MNVIIYGAGEAGTQIAKYCKGTSPYNLIGFVDDQQGLWGKSIDNIYIYPPNELPDLVKRHAVKEVFVAIPSAKRDRYQAILRNLSTLNVHLRSLPKPDLIIDHRVNLGDVEDVKVEDLLLRPAVEPDEKLLTQNIAGKVVLITGAGGSIGSELCRQIIRLNPKKIILVDHAEFNLYTITQEINLFAKRISVPSSKVKSILMSISDEVHINEVIKEHRPNTIYHAAAYKHVGIVESNILSGVKNNIFGTLYLATAAFENKVDNFILISTDKAVRPTSIMGVTKRIAELILQSFASAEFKNFREHPTQFSMVRFGNVLGSSGSVVPLFQSQINRGGPITVTHQDVTRYFMTISEAAQLVIQASSLASGGEVFLLDMGEPIKILDLAKNMIKLAGMSIKSPQFPNGDIEILITGLAKGEKLFEEMLISGAPKKTIHPKIFMANEDCIAWKPLENYLRDLLAAFPDAKKIQELLVSMVPIYKDAVNL